MEQPHTLTWRTRLSVQGHDPEQDVAVPVVAGLADTPAGGVQVALQVGNGRPVILAIQDARQLAQHLTDSIGARLAITADALADDDQRGDRL